MPRLVVIRVVAVRHEATVYDHVRKCLYGELKGNDGDVKSTSYGYIHEQRCAQLMDLGALIWGQARSSHRHARALYERRDVSPKSSAAI